MSRDPSPWLVIRLGPDVPPGILRLACLRCGDMHDLSLPAPLSTVAIVEADFRERHRNCKEKA